MLVTRLILRKVTKNEALLLEVSNGVSDVGKELSGLKTDLVTLRTTLPGIIATTVSAILREDFARLKV